MADNRIPRLDGPVTDFARLLSAMEINQITQMLSAYESETCHQLAVLTVPTLYGDSIESFSLQVANHWKLGRKVTDNGILIVLASRERAVRIEIGKGFERHISNAKAAEIMNESMIPKFATGAFATGLNAGLSLLIEEARKMVVSREGLPDQL